MGHLVAVRHSHDAERDEDEDFERPRIGKRTLQSELPDRPARSPGKRGQTPYRRGDLDDVFTQGARGGASTLPHRAQMESMFGEDFGDVRVFLGRREELATLGGAAATRGGEVLFADTAPDARVVAHELTHVLQNRGGVGGQGLSAHGDASEVEATSAAQAVATGRRMAPAPRAAASASIQLGQSDGTGGSKTDAPGERNPTHEGLGPNNAPPSQPDGPPEPKIDRHEAHETVPIAGATLCFFGHHTGENELVGYLVSGVDWMSIDGGRVKLFTERRKGKCIARGLEIDGSLGIQIVSGPTVKATQKDVVFNRRGLQIGPLRFHWSGEVTANGAKVGG